MFNWQGRTDTEDGDKGLRWHQVVNQQGHSDLPVINLVGLASDLGVRANKGRPGANEGPVSIREALANLPWHWGARLIDSGDTLADSDLSDAQSHYANAVSQALLQSQFVLGLGGGHEIAWGSYQGLYNALQTSSHQSKKIGIVNFDAHFDLRRPAPYTSSGTPFRQIHAHCEQHGDDFQYACIGISRAANTQALFDFADTTGTRYLLDTQCTLDAAKALLTPMLQNVDQLYVTICLDAFPASAAPGVSAPGALGIDVLFVIQVLRFLAQQQTVCNYRWALCDIAEMNPAFDIDKRTAKLAARLGFEVADALLPTR